MRRIRRSRRGTGRSYDIRIIVFLTLLLSIIIHNASLVVSLSTANDTTTTSDVTTAEHDDGWPQQEEEDSTKSSTTTTTTSCSSSSSSLGVQSIDAANFLRNGTLHLRALIIVDMPPFAVLRNDEATTTTTTTELNQYFGLMPDILREIQRIARTEDNITLTVSLDPIENSFEKDVFQSSLDDLAVDCNTTSNPNPFEECLRYDLAIGPYWPNLGDRSLKSLFTPPLMETGSAVARYNNHNNNKEPQNNHNHMKVQSLAAAELVGSPVCMDGGDFSANYEDDFLALYPNLTIHHYCDTQQECFEWLQDPEECVLFLGDELVLRHGDPRLEDQQELVVLSDNTFRQFIAWAINARLDWTPQLYLRKWIYRAKEGGFLDRLVDDYFKLSSSSSYCPLGKAGIDCDLPCHPLHGTSNKEGVCICDSTKWTGNDCSVEVLEDYTLIPPGIKYAAYGLMGINFAAVAFCAVWLFVNWSSPKVRAAQPLFLSLVLLGCLISTSTILAMAQESAGGGEEPPPACMAVPWLYSVGFCITFGSLFAKIRRINTLFRAARRFQKIQVTTRETLLIVGGILALDVSILLSWTVADPLEWDRTVLNADKYGTPLKSVGYCVSDHWMVFMGLIALFHFLLMSVASYMCYKARNVPTRFYEGKYIALAMISNLQIFVVALPVLFILGVGEEGGTSFVLRSAVIWMNDFVVLFLIFGNLMGIFHEDGNNSGNSGHYEQSQGPTQQSLTASNLTQVSGTGNVQSQGSSLRSLPVSNLTQVSGEGNTRCPSQGDRY